MKRTLKRTLEKTLSLVLVFAMLITTFCVFDIGSLKSNAWLNATEVSTDGRPTADILVPETIYLKYGSNNFQYYVDASNKDKLSNDPAKTTGAIVFNCSQSCEYIKVYCEAASGTLTSVTVGESSGAGTTVLASASDTPVLTTEITAGQATATSVLKWKFEYKCGSHTYYSFAFTYVYGPNGVIGASGFAGRAKTLLARHRALETQFFLTAGTHTTGEIKTPDGDYQNYTWNLNGTDESNTKNLSPLLIPIGTEKADIDYPVVSGKNNDGDETFSNITNAGIYKSGGSTAAWEAIQSGEHEAYLFDVNTPTASITVDVSRYSNLNQIPNLQIASYWSYNEWGNPAQNTYSVTTGTVNDKPKNLSYVKFAQNNGHTNKSDEGKNYYYSTRINCAISGDTTVFIKNRSEFKYTDVMDNMYINVEQFSIINVTGVNKSSLRSAYRTACGTALQESEISNNATFLTNLQTAGKELGDPTSKTTSVTIGNPTNLEEIKPTSLSPEITFYVPETIYLKPADNNMTTFDKYLDRANSVDGAINSGASTSGNIYFNCPGATNVTITQTGASEIKGATLSASASELKTSITGGSVPALGEGQTSQIEWTATYVVDSVTYTAKTYTTVYAPVINPVAAQVFELRRSGTSSNREILNSTIWVTGASSIEDLGSGYTQNDIYSNAKAKYSPLTSDTVVSKSGSSTDPSNGDTLDGCYTSGTGYVGYHGYWWKTDNNSGGSRDYTCRWVPWFYYDSSRFTNMNQFPNFKVGIDIHENWGGSGDGTTYWRLGYNLNLTDTNNTNILEEQSSSGSNNKRPVGRVLNTTPSISLKDIKEDTACTFRGYPRARNNGNEAHTNMVIYFVLGPVNKTDLRKYLNDEVAVGRQEKFYTPSTWSAYQTALKNAYNTLGNPAATSADKSALQTAVDNLKYKEGKAKAIHINSETGAMIETENLDYTYGSLVTAGNNSYTGYTYKDDYGKNLVDLDVWKNTISGRVNADKGTLGYDSTNRVVTITNNVSTEVTTGHGINSGFYSIPSAPGKTYRAVFTAERTAGSGSGEMFLFAYADSGDEIWLGLSRKEATSNGTYCFDFTTPANTTRLQFRLDVNENNPNTTWKYSNVMIYEIGVESELSVDTILQPYVDWVFCYTPNHYNVTYNPDGGTFHGGGHEGQTAAYSKEVSYDSTQKYGDGMNPPTRQGYIFDGWICSVDPEGVAAYTHGGSYVWKYLSDVTFTAKWRHKEFRLIYRYRSEDNNSREIVATPPDGREYFYTDDNIETLTAAKALLGGIYKTDYHLTGWGARQDGIDMIGDSANGVKPGSGINIEAIAEIQNKLNSTAEYEDLYLYAYWDQNPTVTYDNMVSLEKMASNMYSTQVCFPGGLGGGTLSYDKTTDTMTIKKTTTTQSEVFTRYSDQAGYYIPVEPGKTYLFSYKATKIVEDGVENNTKHDLFVFYCDRGGALLEGGYYKNFGSSNTENVRNLVFTPPEDCETIRFRFDVDSRTDKEPYYGDTGAWGFSQLRLVPCEEPYVLNPGSSATVNPEYFSSVTYKDTADKYEIYGDDYLYNSNGTYISIVSGFDTKRKPEREGYDFGGWYTDPFDFEEDSKVTGSTPESEYNVALFSRWVPHHFTLYYNANGIETENGTMPSTEVFELEVGKNYTPDDDDIISSLIPKADHQVFAGWNNRKNGDGKYTYYPGNTVSTLELYEAAGTTDNGSVTLYAKWISTETADNNAKNSDNTYKITNPEYDVVKGIQLGADGKWTDIKEAKNDAYKKYDVTSYGYYQTAADEYMSSKNTILNSVTEITVGDFTSKMSALATKVGELEENYNELEDEYFNNFTISYASGTTPISGIPKGSYSLADMNLNHYVTETLDKAQSDLSDGKEFLASPHNITAQETVNEYVRNIANDFVNKEAVGAEPMYKLHETPEKVAEALGKSEDINAVNYVYAGKGYYTYYCYTNKPDPTVVIDIDEIASNNRACYPTKVENEESYDENMVEFSTKTVAGSTVNGSYSELLGNDIGTSLTKSNPNYYNQKRRITLTPSFEGATPKSTVTYTFKTYDDSYVANGGKNYATKSALSGDVFNNNKTTDIAVNSMTPENCISICIDYKPENGFDVTGSQWDEGVDKYIGQYHLWRTSGGASNWEIHGKNDSAANVYAVYDEEYQQLNYCSFFFVFKLGTTDNIENCQLSSKSLDHVHEIVKTGLSSENGLPAFKQAHKEGGTGLGYQVWSGSDGWAPNLYPLSNSYVYVHVVDRWGNTVDKVLDIGNIDPKAVNAKTSSAGSVLLEESGGSGIATASLNAKSIQIITDDDSTLVDNVYRTTGNTIKLYTGEPNKSYTLNVNDKAANATTATVKTDSEGYLVITVEDEDYTYDGAYTFTLGSFEINLYDGIIKHIKKVENGAAYVGEKATATITTSDEVTMAQLMSASGSTSTATTYVDNGNGTRTWKIDRKLTEGVHEYTVRVKVNGKWLDEGKTVTLTFTKKPEPPIGEVVSVDYTPSTSAKNTFKVTVTGNPDYIQFVYPGGGTDTFTKDRAEIEGDVWTVKATLPAGDYSARARYNGKWCEKTAFSVALLEKEVPDANVYSIEIEGQDGNILKSGKHEVTVVTGKAVTKVMLKNTVTGSTNTYTADNAKIEEVEGKLVWKFTKNFQAGTDTTYSVKVRTATSTSFADSGKTIDVVVD